MQHHAEHGEHLFGESYTLSQTPFQGVAWKMQSPEPELVDGLEGSLWVLCSWGHRELMSDPPPEKAQTAAPRKSQH